MNAETPKKSAALTLFEHLFSVVLALVLLALALVIVVALAS